MQSLRSKLARSATFVIWRRLELQKLRICHQLAALIGDNDAVMVENELHRPNTIVHKICETQVTTCVHHSPPCGVVRPLMANWL